ncbi:MAG TPA: hypothetical protein VHX88_05990 [Solirubrobacteraceae bacterium]|jgi:hypothetical protein|nr:hypothetical protein [Solirubrobacteraceae bacterium]
MPSVPDDQSSLLDELDALESDAPLNAERPGRDVVARRSSKAIGPGDIVEVDKKGRRFHALVRELEQLESGRFELVLRPLDSRVSYHRATVREVVGVWRRARGRG